MNKEYGIAEFELVRMGLYGPRDEDVIRFEDLELEAIGIGEPWLTDGESGIAIRMTNSIGVYWADEDWCYRLAGELEEVNLKDWCEQGEPDSLGFATVQAIIEVEKWAGDYPEAEELEWHIVGLVDLQYMLADTAQRLRDAAEAAS